MKSPEQIAPGPEGDSPNESNEVAQILKALKKSDPEASTQLLPLVYEDLRRLASQRMAKEIAGQTLQPTALVHEAWLRLTRGENVRWEGRAHFFGAAAEAMRRILIDNARKKNAVRHGGGQQRVDLVDLDLSTGTKDEALLALDEALRKLEIEDKEKAELIKLRYFIGLSFDDAAEVLGVSVPTAKRWWAYARAWLYRELHQS